MNNRLLFPALLALLSGCAMHPAEPIRIEPQVDLQRFMGDWYVIASIPTIIETEAYNAIESYELTDDGKIATTFTFRKGGFDGKLKTYNPTGFVREDTGNAIWGMQFIWPFKADYRIVYVDPDYSQTIIGRQDRDYAWIMTRSPQIPQVEYDRLVAMLIEQGYDVSELRKVPQRWPSDDQAPKQTSP